MARASKLAEGQWREIHRRVDDGESRAALGREFGVSGTAIGKHRQIEAARTVASILAGTDLVLRDALRDTSMHLAGAAKLGAATAHRLAKIANHQTAKISKSNPMESTEVLQAISALSKMANEAAALGLSLMKTQTAVSAPEGKKAQANADAKVAHVGTEWGDLLKPDETPQLQ